MSPRFESDDSMAFNEDHGGAHQERPRSARRQVSISADSQQAGVGRSSRAARRLDGSWAAVALRSAARRGADELSWYERLLPECLLSLTAPLTGYERQSDMGHLNERECAILERERLRRNRRVRRRLVLILAVASIASAYFFYRGRVPMRRPQGVRGTINEVAHRIEDGLSKTFHDTVGK